MSSERSYEGTATDSVTITSKAASSSKEDGGRELYKKHAREDDVEGRSNDDEEDEAGSKLDDYEDAVVVGEDDDLDAIVALKKKRLSKEFLSDEGGEMKKLLATSSAGYVPRSSKPLEQKEKNGKGNQSPAKKPEALSPPTERRKPSGPGTEVSSKNSDFVSENLVKATLAIPWSTSVGKRPPRDMKRLDISTWYIVCRVSAWGDTPALYLRSPTNPQDSGFYKPPQSYFEATFEVADQLRLSGVGYSASRNKIARDITVYREGFGIIIDPSLVSSLPGTRANLKPRRTSGRSLSKSKSPKNGDAMESGAHLLAEINAKRNDGMNAMTDLPQQYLSPQQQQQGFYSQSLDNALFQGTSHFMLPSILSTASFGSFTLGNLGSPSGNPVAQALLQRKNSKEAFLAQSGLAKQSSAQQILPNTVEGYASLFSPHLGSSPNLHPEFVEGLPQIQSLGASFNWGPNLGATRSNSFFYVPSANSASPIQDPSKNGA